MVDIVVISVVGSPKKFPHAYSYHVILLIISYLLLLF